MVREERVLSRLFSGMAPPSCDSIVRAVFPALYFEPNILLFQRVKLPSICDPVRFFFFFRQNPLLPSP